MYSCFTECLFIHFFVSSALNLMFLCKMFYINSVQIVVVGFLSSWWYGVNKNDMSIF